MSEAYKTPNSIASLSVLPSSDKASQLRREFEAEKQQAAMQNVKPLVTTIPGEAPVRSIEYKLLEGKIIAAISQVYDPEIPVNVYDLGLIYGIEIAEDKSVKILMTLTAPGCPVAGSLPAEVARKAETVPEVKDAEVELVWEPAWDKSRMSEVAQLQLGIF